jgi:catechol 2,3-dioxygenase-like lactoylglutathione lyase family enzyme
MTDASVGPLKRITLWVRDIDASLAVYRDALGLDVLEDKRLAGPQIARMVGLEQAELRIVHLGPAGSTQGWVGLYGIENTAPRAMAALPQADGFPRYGQATLVFSTGSLAAILPRLRALATVRFITEPTEYVKTTPGDATPPGKYSEVIFFDPDGVPVSLMGYQPL